MIKRGLYVLLTIILFSFLTSQVEEIFVRNVLADQQPALYLLDNNTVSELMRSNGVHTTRYIISDEITVLPTENWIRGEFTRGLSEFQKHFQIARWHERANDCDKFSSATKFYAQWLNFKSTNRSEKASLAVGELYFYVNGSNKAHAINFFITLDKNKKLKLIFYEPQKKIVMNLSEIEKSSIFFWNL